MYLMTTLALLHSSSSILYDGSPFIPTPHAFLRLLETHRVTDLGTSPRFLHELQKASISPRDILDLSSLRSVTSTGMVLTDAQFEWFYDAAFPQTVHSRRSTLSAPPWRRCG